jgi:transcriptional regulator with XRE-family HTH domain
MSPDLFSFGVFMSIDFSSLPLSPNQSRAGRNYLGLSQTQAAERSGLQGHKLKRFESGTYVPDTPFLQELRDFFEQNGYSFHDEETPGAKAKSRGDVFPAGVVGKTASSTEETDGFPSENQGKPQRPVASQLHHIRIDPTLNNDQIDAIFDCIEDNESAVAALLDRKLSRGMLFSESLDAKGQALQVAAQRRLAENGLLFALLLGRAPVAVPEGDSIKLAKDAKTHGELLQASMADVQRAVVHGDKDAHARRKDRSEPAEVMQALIG